MPGATYMMSRYYWQCAAGAMAGRTPTRAPCSERPAHKPMTDHASDLRAACERLNVDPKVCVDERMVTI